VGKFWFNAWEIKACPADANSTAQEKQIQGFKETVRMCFPFFLFGILAFPYMLSSIHLTLFIISLMPRKLRQARQMQILQPNICKFKYSRRLYVCVSHFFVWYLGFPVCVLIYSFNLVVYNFFFIWLWVFNLVYNFFFTWLWVGKFWFNVWEIKAGSADANSTA